MAERKKRYGRIKKWKQALAGIGTLNLVLILVGLFFVWFNWEMISLFRQYKSMPETYACAVVAATIGEAGICGWIRTTKDKKQEHDRERSDLMQDREWEQKQRKDEGNE